MADGAEGAMSEGGEGAEGSASGAAIGAEELATVRELALRAHPDVVPELVGGSSVAEIVASVEPARAAYQRVAGAVSSRVTVTEVPSVPAGNAPAMAVDPDLLPAAEKIRRGLASRR